MGFLSKYTGNDIVDLGDGYNITLKKFLAGNVLEQAQAARAKAITETTANAKDKERKVVIVTSVDTATYTDLLLMEAIVTWNITDQYDNLLPLAPEDAKLKSIQMLPAETRELLRDRIEANTESTKRDDKAEADFRSGSEVVAPA